MVVNISDFGAKSDGNLQTEKIQKAIDFCYEHGGGEVVIPEGEFYTGGIRLRSNITLRLLEDAHLIGSRNPNDYMGILEDKIQPLNDEDLTDVLWLPVNVRENFHHMNKAGSRWNNAVIRVVDAENVSIIGEKGSYIDGRDCFDELGEENYRGPHAVNFHRCKNIRFCGYEIRNSANWAHSLFDCENIVAENLKVIAGHDGIHMTSCKDIKIRNCEFYTGDDCVAGIDNENVVVEKCILNTACSAFRFGGRNVRINKCDIFGPAKYLFRGSLSEEEKREGKSPDESHRYNMLGLFTYYADFSREIKSVPGDIVIENCSVKNADRLIHYNFSGNEPWQKNKPLNDITLKNIMATGIKNPITLYGAEDNPVSAEISGLEISFEKPIGAFMNLCHYKEIILEDVNVRNIDSNPLIKKWSDDGEIIYRNFVYPANTNVEGMAMEEFECMPI